MNKEKWYEKGGTFNKEQVVILASNEIIIPLRNKMPVPIDWLKRLSERK